MKLIAVAVLAVLAVDAMQIQAPPCKDAHPVCESLCSRGCAKKNEESVGFAISKRHAAPPPSNPCNDLLDATDNVINVLCPKSCGTCQKALPAANIATLWTQVYCAANGGEQEASVGLAF